MDKLVKSSWMNKLGLQVWRMKLAHKKYNSKTSIIPDELLGIMNDFEKNGLYQIDNFLSTLEFEGLKRECQNIKEEGLYKKYSRKDGPNTIYMLDVFSLDLSKYPYLTSLLSNTKLNALFTAMERRPINILKKSIIVQFQYLVQGEDDGSHDPETDLHADTFFNTHKAWLYMDDVNVENGPFVFVPTTHNIFLDGRLDREKEFSKDINSKGSRRVMKEELKHLSLSESVYTCSANTLVMANTLGYHRRLRGKAGHERLTIAFSARSNPFF